MTLGIGSKPCKIRYLWLEEFRDIPNSASEFALVLLLLLLLVLLGWDLLDERSRFALDLILDLHYVVLSCVAWW